MSREVEVLRLLYPKSIPVEEYEHAIQLIRLSVSAGHSKRVTTIKAPEEQSALKRTMKRVGGGTLEVSLRKGVPKKVYEYIKANTLPTSKQIQESLGLTYQKAANAVHSLKARGFIEGTAAGWKVKS